MAGIEVTTGPLGQGIANAFGMAVAEAYLTARFGDGAGRPLHLCLRRRRLPAGRHRPGDDLAGRSSAPGQARPAVGRQPHHRRRRHRACRSAKTWPSAFASAGWHVVEVDGHDIEAVSRRSPQARRDPRPSLIACRTVIARGIARLQGQRGGHSARLYPKPTRTPRASRSTGRTRPSRCRPTCWAPGATPAAAAQPNMRRGRRGWPRCPQPSAPSSSA